MLNYLGSMMPKEIYEVPQMPEETTNRYDEYYFTWQASLGKFGGWADQSKFVGYLLDTDTVFLVVVEFTS